MVAAATLAIAGLVAARRPEGCRDLRGDELQHWVERNMCRRSDLVYYRWPSECSSHDFHVEPRTPASRSTFATASDLFKASHQPVSDRPRDARRRAFELSWRVSRVPFSCTLSCDAILRRSPAVAHALHSV
jgi:hypothetical protein